MVKEQIKLVEEWGEECGIFKHSNYKKQFEKTVEEVTELGQALLKETDEEAQGELGDVLVTLILLCRMKGWDLFECLDKAYTKINKRKGIMVNGKFVKSNDLPVCKHYDCGWCYHPRTTHHNGCVGIFDCGHYQQEVEAGEYDV